MRLFAGRLDPRIVLAEGTIADAPADLRPGEAQFIAQAVPRRSAEFAAGRAYARRALSGFGFGDVELPSLPDRTVGWPAGMVGAITHSDTLCAAAVARVTDGIFAVGLDLEPAEPLSRELWEHVCDADELATIADLPSADQGLAAKMIFSAKEAAFKAQYTLTRRMLEFSHLNVALDGHAGAFTATFQLHASPFQAGDRLPGRIWLAEAHIAAAVVLTDGRD